MSRLAVRPGSHLLPIENPGLVNELLLAFLRGGFPSPPAAGEQPG